MVESGKKCLHAGAATHIHHFCIRFHRIVQRISSFVNHNPGIIGSKRVNPLRSNVAVNAASNVTPSILNIATHVASKVPNPRVTGLRVATTDATTKLGKATRNDTSWPTALSITFKVYASSRKIVP